MNNRRIIPLNLPACLDVEPPGNPAVARLETVPANCFPGLDIDVRNLDRRFFPGLLFDFVRGEGTGGARLVAADPSDIDMPQNISGRIVALAGMLQKNEEIFLASVADEDGNKIELRFPKNPPLDASVVWRIVRSLVPGKITIALSVRRGRREVRLRPLTGVRRVYRNEAGELSSVFLPGELTQSLCSPWHHDFRGCSCTYWASNHPDIVLAAHPADLAEVDDPGVPQDRAQDPVLWMRWNRHEDVPPRADGDGCRPLEMDGYEISARWRELSFVLEGREQPAPWSLVTLKEAPPIRVDEILPELARLAGIELAVALEYLYARYTVTYYDSQLTSELAAHADFIAHELLNIAIGEMMHLRWANRLLHRVASLTGKIQQPVLVPGAEVPQSSWKLDEGRTPRYTPRWRVAEERPIDVAIEDFIAAEAPSGTLEGLYARVLSTFKTAHVASGIRFPDDVIELVERIISDGVDHYSRFREIQEILARPGGQLLVRPLVLLNLQSNHKDYNTARSFYSQVVRQLRAAYGKSEEQAFLTMQRAAEAMRKMDAFAIRLAKRGFGIPFLQIGKEIALPSTAVSSTRKLPGHEVKATG